MEYYLYIKSLHIIFMVCWFAALFYLPRLYIYLIEAQDKDAAERAVLTRQFVIMIGRLWHIIGWPAAGLTTLFGVWLLILNDFLMAQGWVHIKLLLVAMLIVYHIWTYRMFISFKAGRFKYSSGFIRVWNEVATVLLFAIVFLAVLKSSLHWVFALISLLGLILLLMAGIKLYKKTRSKTR